MYQSILRHIVIEGVTLCLLLGVLVMASLKYNPRLWLQDYPKRIRDKVPPLNKREKVEQGLITIPFLLLAFGLPFLGVLLVKSAHSGSIPFVAAYLTAAGILQLFNLFDAVVLDYFILTLMKPRFMIIPGTTQEDYLLSDLGLQVRNFFKGVVICAALAIPIALVGNL